MTTLNDRKLLLLIRYVPSLIVALFAVLATIAYINDGNRKAQQSVASLRNNLLEHQQAAVEQTIHQIYRTIEFRQSQTVKELKQQAYQRVGEAHQIATHIFEQNPNKSKSEITKLISDALKPIRFYNGRGYFFIFQMNGINVMHALKPHIEGSSGWNSQDINGTYILREHINLIKQNGGEAFYHWWYQKPGYPATQEFEKIGYGKAFEPYDWFIGTGEYVADVEKDVKASVLNWIGEYQTNQDEKVFIFDMQGKLLLHENRALVGKSILTLPADMQHLFEVAQSKSDLSGVPYIDIDEEGSEEFTYLQSYEPWGWYIGSSFSEREFQTYLDTQQQQLEDTLNERLTRLIALSLFSILAMVGLSYLISQIIVKRFDKFQRRINTDFGKLEESKNQLHHMAMHDPLTGLSNRTALLETIAKGLKVSKENDRHLAIAFLDLDDFKKINDLYGHAVGDKLLECLSRKFESILGDNDSVSRFGGDEFIFSFSNLDSRETAKQKVEKLSAVFKESFIIDGKILTTDASIGVSMFPSDSSDPETLIINADIVLYRTKAANKGAVQFYDESITEQIKQEYRIEEAMRFAIKHNELSVLYQPQVSASTETLVSVEALVRWNSHTLGPIYPDQFIPMAERNGMINDIGMFVFKRACQDVLQLSPNGSSALKISVNISPKQLLDQSFSDSLMRVVKEVGIELDRITLEVTESMPISDLVKITPVLQELQLLGFSISLDDFGTGYSSLSHLNDLPINELKIDRSFISMMSGNAQSHALVKAILAIGKSYDLTIVAEGVETKEQQLMLKGYGCELIQGYYYSKPIPIQELRQWVAGQEQA